MNSGAFAPLSGAPFVAEDGDAGFIIGAFIGATNQGDFPGSLGAILVYDSALFDEDVDRVREYLGSKYGINV